MNSDRADAPKRDILTINNQQSTSQGVLIPPYPIALAPGD